MKKTIFLFAAVLLILFAAITLLKPQATPMDPSGTTDARTTVEKENVQRFWTLYRQATDHRMAGRLAEAAAAYRKALALNDRHEDALYYLGNMYLELEDFAAAQEAWEHLAAVNPNSARAYTRLGTIFLCSDEDNLYNLTTAEAAFRQALKLNKEETGPLLSLGQIALIQGNLDEAQIYFQAVTGSNYKSIEAYFLAGYVAWKQGAIQQAVPLFAEAVRQAQPHEPTQGVLGEGDTKTGSEPLVPGTSGCPIFQPYLDILAHMQEAPHRIILTQQYQELDRFLEFIRKKTAVRPDPSENPLPE